MASDSAVPSGRRPSATSPSVRDAPGGVVHRLVAGARLRGRDARQLGVQHHLVDAALGRGEAAVHREGAGDVGGVIAPLAAGVDEEEVAVLHPPPVLVVVEDQALAPEATMDGYALRGRAALPEHELDRRLHLVLVVTPAARSAWPRCGRRG
jgi:hypothetical protein